MTTPLPAAEARAFLAARRRWRWPETLPWIVAVGAFFLFPNHMALGTQILILILFALSLDLILGYAGIITLGHAAYFGIGAYAQGMLSAHLGWTEPLSGLLAAGAAAALYGLFSGWILLRYHGLTLLMLTLVAAILLLEAANAAHGLTGGYDGLMGISFAPLLGRFGYDLWGHTHYWYALTVLFLVFLAARRIVNSPFGQALIGIRENTVRMHAIGAPVHRRLVTIYTISAAMAGIAGALYTQSNAFLTLDVLSFGRSGAVLLVLILGGTGRLYGAFVGGAVYALLEDWLAKISPEFWEFGVGLALVLVVVLGRQGLLGTFDMIASGLRRRSQRRRP